MPRPYGHECARRNVCFDCQGRLRARRLDAYSEIMYDDGRRAFAAPVCATCKLLHVQLQGAPRVPLSFAERLKQLSLADQGVNWSCAMWSRVIIDEDEDCIKERRYVVRYDGTMITRFDTCDLRRSFHSFEGSGWKEHQIKKHYKNVRALLEAVDEQLTALGYERQF